MRYIFKKRCKVCDVDFYSKELDKTTSDNLSDNPNIAWEFPDMKTDVSILYSYCASCADEYYKSTD